jgi:hypothetical protein
VNGKLLEDVDNHARRLAVLEDELEVVTGLVDGLVRGDDAPIGAAGKTRPFEPAYPSLEKWVTDHFAPTFARALTPTTRWCAAWWDHAEAISRLEGLWRTWEVARLEPLAGIATWYRDYLDPQLAVLLSPTGPFHGCTADRHEAAKPLPLSLAPDGHWVGPQTPPQGVPHV